MFLLTCFEGVVTLPCDLSHGTFDITYQPCRQTCENITFSQLYLQAAMMQWSVKAKNPRNPIKIIDIVGNHRNSKYQLL